MLTVRPALRAALSAFAAATLLLSAVPSLRAQYQITTLGATITENFDSYASTAGTTAPTFTNSLNTNTTTSAAQRTSAWSYYTASNTGASAVTSTQFQANDPGNGSTGGFRSYGANGTTDRALGILASSSFGTFNGVAGNTNGVAAVAAQFTNATGGTITSLVISFTGEQWRQVTSAASFITVGYSVTSASAAISNAVTSPLSGMTFNAISLTNALGAGNSLTTNSPVNGDAAAYRNTTYTATITGLNILSGSSVNLAFVYAGGAGGGSRQGLAIDDLSVLANGISAAASLLWSGSDGDTWSTTSPQFNANATTWNNVTNATSIAEFGSAAQTINVGAVTAGGLKFSNTGITLNGGTITDGNASGGLSVEVVNGSDTATVNSSISGTNGLTKVGSGTLILGGTQSALSGTITVSSGTLQSDTTTLATRTITNNGTLNFAQGSDGTFSGTLTNAGTFIKSGAGNLTISTAVSGAGATNITGGTLTAGIDGAVATGALSVGSGSTLDLATHAAAVSSLTLADSTVANVGTLTVSGGITVNAVSGTSTISGGTLALGSASRSFTVADGTAASDLTISSALTGSSTLTKSGAGTLTLTGTNSGFTGVFTLNGGTVIADNNTALGAGQLTLTTGILQGNGTALTLSPTKVLISGNSTIGGSTDITFASSTPWQQAGGASGNTFTINNTGSTTINGNIDLDQAAAARTLTLAGAGNLTINGTILSTSGPGAIKQAGSGTLTLSGANTYTGGTTVTSGILAATTSNTALGTGAVSVTGGTLSLGDSIKIANALTVGTGGVVSGSGSAELDGTINNTGTFTGSLTLGSTATLTTGAAPGLTHNTGSLTFSAGSTYTWNLTSLKDTSTGIAGTNFNQIGNTGIIALNGGLLNLVLSTLAPDQLDPFWNANHSWTIVASTGGGTITGTALNISNSQTPWAGVGTFSTALSGNNLVLDWTASAVPEPSTYAAMAGVLALSAALIRRRRQAKTQPGASPLTEPAA